LSTPKNYSADI